MQTTTARTLWFTADTHFGHANIVNLCYRPFKTVDDMDAAILDRLNRCVGERDDLYHLGDFAFGGRWREYRDRITCQRVHLILGNHDPSKEGRRALRDGLFVSVDEYLRLKHDGVKLLLCHYPLESWRPGYRHLHGHSHGDSTTKLGRLDVGVDASMFSPVSFGLVREIAVPDFADRHARTETAT